MTEILIIGTMQPAHGIGSGTVRHDIINVFMYMLCAWVKTTSMANKNRHDKPPSQQHWVPISAYIVRTFSAGPTLIGRNR